MERLLAVSVPLAALAALLFTLERLFPLRQQRLRLAARLVANLALSAFAFAAAGFLVRPLVAVLLGWTGKERFGLGHVVELAAPLRGVFCFLLMDLTFYYWHLANHRVSLLWRFHVVHHLDPDLDLTTALRFHFGEIGLSSALRVLQITLIGIDPITYVVYETAFQASTLFHHSNLRLPIALERRLNAVLVTPRMHGIHHSQVQRETNSNYSVVLPWWDRIHRTLRLHIPQQQLTIGVPAYGSVEDQRLWRLLAMPFLRQREYWRLPDGSLVEREPTRAATAAGPERVTRMAE